MEGEVAPHFSHQPIGKRLAKPSCKGRVAFLFSPPTGQFGTRARIKLEPKHSIAQDQGQILAEIIITTFVGFLSEEFDANAVRMRVIHCYQLTKVGLIRRTKRGGLYPMNRIQVDFRHGR